MRTPQNTIINQFGTNVKESIEVNDATLQTIDRLFGKSLVIISKSIQEPLYLSDRFIHEFSLFGHDHVLEMLKSSRLQTDLSEFSLVLTHQGVKRDYCIECVNVKYKQLHAVLFVLSDRTLSLDELTADSKINRISIALLNLFNSIDIGDDIGKTLSLVLAEAIKAFRNGHFGAVFVVQGNTFKIISNIGYSSDIENFQLPIKDSFLYQSTNGRMDDLVMINDLRTNYKIYPIKSNTGEISMIKSSIVAPIFYKDSLYGTLGIDSNDLNAFDENDLIVMRFIRDNIQTIISNQLSFLERTNQALTDHMTGLYNRHFLTEHFNSILERAKRYDERFCVVVFDLDNLKETNDHFGHLAGDLVIKAFAKTIQSHARRSDIVARFGGDEFVAIYLMCDRTTIEQKLQTLELEPAVLNLNHISTPLPYGYSFGVSSYPEDGETFVDLINTADARMYNYKSQGT